MQYHFKSIKTSFINYKINIKFLLWKNIGINKLAIVLNTSTERSCVLVFLNKNKNKYNF